MSKFNPFEFLKNRRNSVTPTDEELDTFDPYMTQMALSMKGYVNVLDLINTTEFFNLPKDIQCKAYTSFDGYDLSAPWKKSKKTAIEKKDEYIQKLMTLYKMSRSEAESCIRFKTVDFDEIDDLYTRIYEPEKINFRKTKSKK